MDILQLLKTSISTIVMGIVLYFSYFELMNLNLGNTSSTLVATLAGAIIYIVILIIVGGLNQRDLANVPMIGNLLMKLLVRLGVTLKK